MFKLRSYLPFVKKDDFRIKKLQLTFASQIYRHRFQFPSEKEFPHRHNAFHSYASSLLPMAEAQAMKLFKFYKLKEAILKKKIEKLNKNKIRNSFMTSKIRIDPFHSREEEHDDNREEEGEEDERDDFESFESEMKWIEEMEMNEEMDEEIRRKVIEEKPNIQIPSPSPCHSDSHSAKDQTMEIVEMKGGGEKENKEEYDDDDDDGDGGGGGTIVTDLLEIDIKKEKVKKKKKMTTEECILLMKFLIDVESKSSVRHSPKQMYEWLKRKADYSQSYNYFADYYTNYMQLKKNKGSFPSPAWIQRFRFGIDDKAVEFESLDWMDRRWRSVFDEEDICKEGIDLGLKEVECMEEEEEREREEEKKWNYNYDDNGDSDDGASAGHAFKAMKTNYKKKRREILLIHFRSFFKKFQMSWERAKVKELTSLSSSSSSLSSPSPSPPPPLSYSPFLLMNRTIPPLFDKCGRFSPHCSFCYSDNHCKGFDCPLFSFFHRQKILAEEREKEQAGANVAKDVESYGDADVEWETEESSNSEMGDNGKDDALDSEFNEMEAGRLGKRKKEGEEGEEFKNEEINKVIDERFWNYICFCPTIPYSSTTPFPFHSPFFLCSDSQCDRSNLNLNGNVASMKYHFLSTHLMWHLKDIISLTCRRPHPTSEDSSKSGSSDRDKLKCLHRQIQKGRNSVCGEGLERGRKMKKKKKKDWEWANSLNDAKLGFLVSVQELALERMQIANVSELVEKITPTQLKLIGILTEVLIKLKIKKIIKKKKRKKEKKETKKKR